MATATASQVKELREKTGAGIMDCKEALTASDGAMDAAIDFLRKKGLQAAAKRAARSTQEGLIGSYIHGGGRLGVLVEVNCETDFVARTDDMQALVHDLAMQVAASNPLYLSRDDVPAAVIAESNKKFEMAMYGGMIVVALGLIAYMAITNRMKPKPEVPEAPAAAEAVDGNQ